MLNVLVVSFGLGFFVCFSFGFCLFVGLVVLFLFGFGCLVLLCFGVLFVFFGFCLFVWDFFVLKKQFRLLLQEDFWESIAEACTSSHREALWLGPLLLFRNFFSIGQLFSFGVSGVIKPHYLLIFFLEFFVHSFKSFSHHLCRILEHISTISFGFEEPWKVLSFLKWECERFKFLTQNFASLRTSLTLHFATVLGC